MCEHWGQQDLAQAEAGRVVPGERVQIHHDQEHSNPLNHLHKHDTYAAIIILLIELTAISRWNLPQFVLHSAKMRSRMPVMMEIISWEKYEWQA